jgi:hypothetical protein
MQIQSGRTVPLNPTYIFPKVTVNVKQRQTNLFTIYNTVEENIISKLVLQTAFLEIYVPFFEKYMWDLGLRFGLIPFGII